MGTGPLRRWKVEGVSLSFYFFIDTPARLDDGPIREKK
jgi:hypothetical protein